MSDTGTPIRTDEDTSSLLLCLATYEQICAELLRRAPPAMILAIAVPTDKVESRAKGLLDSYVMTGGGLGELDMLCMQIGDSIDRKLRELGR